MATSTKLLVVKRWLKEHYAYALALLPIIAYYLYKAFVKREIDAPITPPAVELHKKIAEVRVEAALEIGKAKGKELAVKEEVKHIMAMPIASKEDKRKQLQDLSDLINRTRR